MPSREEFFARRGRFEATTSPAAESTRRELPTPSPSPTRSQVRCHGNHIQEATATVVADVTVQDTVHRDLVGQGLQDDDDELSQILDGLESWQREQQPDEPAPHQQPLDEVVKQLMLTVEEMYKDLAKNEE